MTTTVKDEQIQLKQFNFYYLPFIIDYLLRWLALGWYRSGNSVFEVGKSETSFWIFIVLNIIITIATLSHVIIHYSRLKAKYSFITEQDYDFRLTIFTAGFLVFLVLTVNYLLYSVISEYPSFKAFAQREGAGAIVPTVIFFIYGGMITFLAFLSLKVPSQYRNQKTTTDSRPKIFFNFRSSKEELDLVEELFPIDAHDYEIDKNDTEIVRLEGHLKNETTRIDAYILESVLFGALAFSAFLTIIASERFLPSRAYDNDQNNFIIVSENNVETSALEKQAEEIIKKLNNNKAPRFAIDSTLLKQDTTGIIQNFIDKIPNKQRLTIEGQEEISAFWQHLKDFFDGILLFNYKKSINAWSELTDTKNLLILIMFQTLFCSLFFLSVIAARLRYSNIAEEIDNLIRLARTFNDKEEEVYILSLQMEENSPMQQNLQRRLAALDKSIQSRIEKAKEFSVQTKPIVFYMSLFRNLGVFTFILILVTSSLFFSRDLATIFLIFSVIAYAYESIDGWLRRRRVRQTKAQITSK